MEEYTKLVTLVETHGLRGILISSSLFVIYTLIKSDWFSNRLGQIGLLRNLYPIRLKRLTH